MTKPPAMCIEDLPVMLTVKEVACLLRVNPKTVREMFHRGEIPGASRLSPKVFRFHRDTVVKWVQQGGVSRSRRKS